MHPEMNLKTLEKKPNDGFEYIFLKTHCVAIIH